MKILNFYTLGKIIPQNAVYIGRASAKHKLLPSKFANPFPLSQESDREAVIGRYREWLMGQITQGKITREDLCALNGKDLVCFCAPKSCHGHVLRDAVQWAMQGHIPDGRAGAPSIPRKAIG